jgi:hypothetical protein
MFSASKLPSVNDTQDAPDNIATADDSVVQGLCCDAGFHPCVDRVSDDPPGDTSLIAHTQIVP